MKSITQIQKRRYPRPEADPFHDFTSKFQRITNRKGFRVQGLRCVVDAYDISRETQTTISGVEKNASVPMFFVPTSKKMTS